MECLVLSRKINRLLATLLVFAMCVSLLVPMTPTHGETAKLAVAGDVNDDGVVDTKDVTILRRHLTQWNVEINLALADVNIDEAIDSKDATLIRRYIAGWDVELKLPASEDSGSTGDGGNTDDPGNTGDGGNTDDPGNTGDGGNTEDPGNTGDGGNTDDPGNTGDGGSTGDESVTVNVASVGEFITEPNVINKLTADITGAIELDGDKYFTLDLAGHKWTNDQSAITLKMGTVYVYDSVGGGAVITSSSDAIVMGNGSAKLENISVVAGGDGMDAIFCNGGNLTVLNCTLSAPKAGINVANASEAVYYEARSVVTVKDGKFANYAGSKDSLGRNCAIEIRNNADEITLLGDITFENNRIISKIANIKTIKEAITVNATFTPGANVNDYVTATISNMGAGSDGSTDTGDGDNSGEDTGVINSTKEVSSIGEFSFAANVLNKLTTDITGGISINGETLLVDLAGHKWSNDQNAISLAMGDIYVFDSVGGGSIVTSMHDAVTMSNGKAKFENISIVSGGDTMDAIFCDGGNLTVINCTLSAPKAGINVANASEDVDRLSRAVVTVNGGKFANYTGIKDLKGRNCAIEIKNNADEITLIGDIVFENNVIISKLTNLKPISYAIKANASYTSGNYLASYITAGISMNSEGNTDGNIKPDVSLDELAEKVIIPSNISINFAQNLNSNGYTATNGLLAIKKNMRCGFNGNVSYPFNTEVVSLNGVTYVDAENFVKMFGLNYRIGEGNSGVIFFNNFEIAIKGDTNTINVNGTEYDFVTTLTYKDSLLISLEHFISAMGYKFTYDNASGIYYFYKNTSNYSNSNINSAKEMIAKYEGIIYNYDDVACDQTGVGIYQKADYEDRKVGIAYTTWNRENFPWSIGSSWSFPLLGKYSSDNVDVVRQHGIWLAEAGVDFVFVDWSNNTSYHPSIYGGTREDFEMIENATDVLFEVWSDIPDAPKICIMAGPGHSGIESVSKGDHQRKVNQIYEKYINNPMNKEMYFHYEGKPLLMCYGATPTQYGNIPQWSDGRFTIRWVTGFVGQQGSLFDSQTLCSERYWSWEERGAQTYTVKNNVVESVTCSAATRAQNSPGQAGYIPASGRQNGATLKRQFQRAIDLGSSFVLLVSWNEWTKSEQESTEISKDLEPSVAHGTFYYDLMREQIRKYKGKI